MWIHNAGAKVYFGTGTNKTDTNLQKNCDISHSEEVVSRDFLSAVVFPAKFVTNPQYVPFKKFDAAE